MSASRSRATFGSLLRTYRLAAGLTQGALAERAGVSRRSVQLLEADGSRPRPDTARRLADALKLDEPDQRTLTQAVVPAYRRRSSGRKAQRLGFDGGNERDGAPILSLVEAVPRHASTPPLGAALTNLPSPLTQMIGRESALTTIRDLLTVDRERLVTLVGVGGAGKTRLSVQVASELLSAFADGVWFVELASISSSAMVPRVVAEALGVREAPDEPLLDSLLGYLRGKALLLVLDNCEHLIDACAHLSERLLSGCPNLQILATSREPLRVAGERRRRVSPLPVPDLGSVTGPDALAGVASVRLFAKRAQAVDAAFQVTPSNAQAVAQICARLDGIPLAIELAASKVDLFTVEQITERLDDCFRVLTGGARRAPTRQQTMEATFGWSYDLLTPAEQATFRTLSVFAGGFDLEAAQRVSSWQWAVRSDLEPPSVHFGLPTDIVDVVSRLVDKSLVVAERVMAGRRYRLLEPVRQYAARALLASGEHERLHVRHAAYYRVLAEQVAPFLRGPDQVAWLDRLEAERDNLRAALTWSIENGSADDRLRLAGALAPYWEGRGHLTEGRHWLEAALTASPCGGTSRPARLQVVLAAGSMARLHRDLPPALALLGEALTLARDLGDRPSEVAALSLLATVHRHRDAMDESFRLSDESIRLGRELGDDAPLALALLHQGMALNARGVMAYAQGIVNDDPVRLDRAVLVLEECVARFRRVGDVRNVAFAATVLGRTCLAAGDHVRATALLREAILASRAVGDQANLVNVLGGLARAALDQADFGASARWLAVLQALRQALGMRYSARNRIYEESIRDALQRQMTPTDFDEAYAAGAAMSLDEALAEIVAT